MADRYQDRRLPAADYDQGGDPHGSDPLAELARLIGQTDPFGNTGRANPASPPRAVPRQRYQQRTEPEPPRLEDETPPAGPPPWMQRANAKAVQREAPREMPRDFARDIARDILPELPPQEDPPAPGHPLYRHAQPAPPKAAEQVEEEYVDEPADEEPGQLLDSSRYDEALYGQIEAGARDFTREAAYPDDPYAYQDDDYTEADERGGKRRGALFKVVALLALAVVGTGSALAYRSYVGSKSSGEPPIIKADNSPTKIVPLPADNTAKAPDRMPSGDGTEKLVSREEAPVDVNTRSAGPRVVFPPLSPSTSSPPTPSSVATTMVPPAGNAAAPTNGTLPNNEPRKIRTFSVRGDQSDSNAAVPVGVPPQGQAGAVPAKPAAGAKASRSAQPSGGGPISLTPDASQAQAAPATRVATTTSPATVPAAPSAAASSGGFLVSVSSQQSEADAQNSFRALQGKFPTQLGSRSPVIKRTELSDKVVYRAMVGPFATADEAKQFCVDYKAAGGQCFVPRN